MRDRAAAGRLGTDTSDGSLGQQARPDHDLDLAPPAWWGRIAARPITQSMGNTLDQPGKHHTVPTSIGGSCKQAHGAARSAVRDAYPHRKLPPITADQQAKTVIATNDKRHSVPLTRVAICRTAHRASSRYRTAHRCRRREQRGAPPLPDKFFAEYNAPSDHTCSILHAAPRLREQRVDLRSFFRC